MTGQARDEHIPQDVRQALRSAVRLEWITIIYMVTCVVLVYLVMGSSQAMKAAWIEDMLAFIPPLAFLITRRILRHEPNPEHPHGFGRATSVGHLVAAAALLAVGVLLIADSAMGLLTAEHPPLGTVNVFGVTLWAGWPMIAVMIYTAIGPVLLARKKLPLAWKLHDRVLFADADMQRADWRTATGTIVGVLGIGLGLWWADSTVAILIAFSIVRDGWRNLHHALRGLMDGRARSVDMAEVHPLVAQVQRTVADHAHVAAARVRVRDAGHRFGVDGFFVPVSEKFETSDMEKIVADVRDLHWKIGEVVLMPVEELPHIPDPRGATHQ